MLPPLFSYDATSNTHLLSPETPHLLDPRAKYLIVIGPIDEIKTIWHRSQRTNLSLFTVTHTFPNTVIILENDPSVAFGRGDFFDHLKELGQLHSLSKQGKSIKTEDLYLKIAPLDNAYLFQGKGQKF